MIDFLVGALSTPGAAWVGLAIGILAAYLAWIFLPESVDRASIGACLIVFGVLGGLAWAAKSERKGK
jgi:hypothetical protein